MDQLKMGVQLKLIKGDLQTPLKKNADLTLAEHIPTEKQKLAAKLD